MDDLAALLDRCRHDAGATVAALVGRDGLLIERAEDAPFAAAGGDGNDLPLAAAEATDLFSVADRLLMDAFAAGDTREAWLAARGATLHLSRLEGGAFTVMLLPPGAEPAAARAALSAARDGLEAGLA